jgi:hypothetical protein
MSDVWFATCLISGVFALMFVGIAIDEYRKSRISKPSDGLVGLICGELRNGSPDWLMCPQTYWGMEFKKKNIRVTYSDFMGEACGLEIDGEAIEISPSSCDALLKVVKPLMKSYAEMKAAEEKARKLCAVVKASQEMLHD